MQASITTQFCANLDSKVKREDIRKDDNLPQKDRIRPSDALRMSGFSSITLLFCGNLVSRHKVLSRDV
jgi:hypothetical protein